MNCLDDDDFFLLVPSRRVDFSYISSSINKFYDEIAYGWKNSCFFSRSCVKKLNKQMFPISF